MNLKSVFIVGVALILSGSAATIYAQERTPKIMSA